MIPIWSWRNEQELAGPLLLTVMLESSKNGREREMNILTIIRYRCESQSKIRPMVGAAIIKTSGDDRGHTPTRSTGTRTQAI